MPAKKYFTEEAKRAARKEYGARAKIRRTNDPTRHGGKDWQFDYHLRTQYGITLAQYREMWDSQGGRCRLCFVELSWRHKNTHLDHDHVTGRVRGILCWHCNSRIGIIEKRGPEGVLADISYLGWP